MRSTPWCGSYHAMPNERAIGNLPVISKQVQNARRMPRADEYGVVHGPAGRSASIEGEKMRTSHRLLLRLFHDPSYDFSRVRVEYINRGAPGDRSAVQGDQIRALDAWYIEVDAGVRVACIPYHRILRILYDDDVVWERKEV